MPCGGVPEPLASVAASPWDEPRIELPRPHGRVIEDPGLKVLVPAGDDDDRDEDEDQAEHTSERAVGILDPPCGAECPLAEQRDGEQRRAEPEGVRDEEIERRTGTSRSRASANDSSLRPPVHRVVGMRAQGGRGRGGETVRHQGSCVGQARSLTVTTPVLGTALLGWARDGRAAATGAVISLTAAGSDRNQDRLIQLSGRTYTTGPSRRSPAALGF